MICYTGNETTWQQLQKRLTIGGFHEIRLDLLLEDIDELMLHQLSQHTNVILTCGSQLLASNPELFSQLIACQPAYIDVDHSNVHLISSKQCGHTKLIYSCHNIGTSQQPEHALQNLLTNNVYNSCHLIKFAFSCVDTMQLFDCANIFATTNRPGLLIGMNQPGVLSRICYQHFRSPWTYVALSHQSTTASGQLTVEDNWYNCVKASPCQLFGLLGDDDCLNSPGFKTYNAIFASRNIPAAYIPLITKQPLQLLPHLYELGFKGISITKPHKQTITQAISQPDSSCSLACNTIAFSNTNQKYTAKNTDYQAFIEIFKQYTHCCPKNAQVLILGSGGAAYAALLASLERGYRVFVSSRIIPTYFNDINVTYIPWENRHQTSCSILINATPLGSNGIAIPYRITSESSLQMVIDLVYHPEPTPLVAQALHHNMTALSGRKFWYIQGAKQMSWLTGISIHEQELELYHQQKQSSKRVEQ